MTNRSWVHSLQRSCNVLKAVAFVTYKEWAAYRSHMVVSLLVGPIYFAIQYFIWHAVFTTRGSINGLTLKQVLTYYGIAAVINYLTFDFADWNLQMLIHTGKFLTFMLRPLSHCYFALAQKVGHRALGLWMEFIPISILFWLIFKIPLWPAQPLWTVLSLLLSFLMTFLVNYSVGIMGFWMTKSEGLRRMFLILRDLLAGAFIPLTFFPEALQKLLFCLPFQFITYVPIRVFIGSYQLAGISLSVPQIVGLQAIAVLGMWGVTEWLWRLGIRRFTGVGA